MGAEVVNEFVKVLLGFWAVDFRKLFHCFFEFIVQHGSVGNSITVSMETTGGKRDQYEIRV